MANSLLRILGVLFLLTGLFSCSPAQWSVEKEIEMAGVAPIGIAPGYEGNFWVSDGDNNRLVLVNKEGEIKQEIANIERPMHIHAEGSTVFVPSYGSDEIFHFTTSQQKTFRISLSISEELDAPAAYHRDEEREAIADFYSHSVLYKAGSGWKRIGEQGQVDGAFRYPTDLQWFGDELYVADAYNHRIQVFDTKGQHLRTFGEEEDMNATTGIFIHQDEVIVTDFENSRLLFYSLAGEFLYVLEKGFDKPTDITYSDENLIVTNYRSGKLTVLSK